MSRAISRCVGEALWTDKIKFIPAKLGDVVVTSAGDLSSKYLFHTITIGSKHLDERFDIAKDKDFDINRFIIENSINKCFRLLLSLDVTSIAFPAIGAGVAKIPYEEVASHMIRSIATNLERTNKSICVELYLYDRYNKMSEWDFLPFFEKIGKYLPDDFSDISSTKEELKDESSVIGQNSNIFISYSRKDQDQASAICELLNKNGISYIILDRQGRKILRK